MNDSQDDNPTPKATDSDSPAPKSPPAPGSAPTKTKKAREKKPEFFGPRGWLAVLLPFIIFLGGLSVGTYFDNARVHTSLKQAGSRSQFIMKSIMSAVQEDRETFTQLRELGWPKVEELKLGEEPEPSLYTDLTNVALGEHYEFEDIQEHSQIAESVLDDPGLRDRVNELVAKTNQQYATNPSTRATFDPKKHGIPTLEEWKEVNDFAMRLLKYEDNHEQRPIIAESFQKFNEWRVEQGEEPIANNNTWFPDDRSWYPTIYTMVIGLTTLAMFTAFPKCLRVPFRVSPLALGVGVVGIVVWIALWWLDKNVVHLGAYFSSSAREHFNPWELNDDTTWMWTFLGIRLWGLVVIIPIVEEFFLRGFLMRYIDSPDWDEEPIGKITRIGLIGILVYAVVTHPAEPLAALAWFGMVTWLFWKTRNIWDCVVAHFVTNLLLGVYVLATKTWELW